MSRFSRLASSVLAFGLVTANVPVSWSASILAPDEKHGLGIHSIDSGNFADPDFGARIASTYLSGQSTVFLANYSDNSWPDALTIGAVAGKMRAPIFITRQDGSLPSADAAYMSTKAANILVAGGTAAIPQATENYWKSQGKSLSRLAGANRYATAAAVAKYFWPQGAGTVILARGDVAADAITAGTVGAKIDAPILLTQPGTLPDDTAAALKAMHPQRIVVAGGTAAVDDVVAAAAVAAAGNAAAERVYGADRYATSDALAKRFFGDANRAFVGLQHDSLRTPTPTGGNSVSCSFNGLEEFKYYEAATKNPEKFPQFCKITPSLSTPNPDEVPATGMWANLLQLAPAAASQGMPLLIRASLESAMEIPRDTQVWVFDPSAQPTASGYRQVGTSANNVDYAWRVVSKMRAEHGLPTLTHCQGKFVTKYHGWGGTNYVGDGSVYATDWDPTIFLVSPPHMRVILHPGTNYVRIIHETLRQSHGDKYAQIKPSVANRMDRIGLAIRIGTCVGSRGGKYVPVEQGPTGPGMNGEETD